MNQDSTLFEVSSSMNSVLYFLPFYVDFVRTKLTSLSYRLPMIRCWSLSPTRLRLRVQHFSPVWKKVVMGQAACLLFCGISLFTLSSTSLADTVDTTSTSSEITTPTPPPKLSASDVSSEKVSQFVKAYLKIVALIDQRESELQRVETESESLQMQRQIRLEAFTLIEASGLTRQEYGQLLGLANSDADFRDRILAQVEETTLQK